MPKPWVAALGSLKGWLLTVAIWAAVIGIYLAVTASSWERTRVFLDVSLAEPIRCEIPVETVVGAFTDPEDAADDYNHAVQEYNGTDRYSGYLALIAQKPIDPDTIDIRATRYLLDAATKAKMDYTHRFTQVSDWTAFRPGYVKAFDGIGQICILKADLLIKAGRTAEAEALLKAVVAFGYHLERERVRYEQTVTGVALQKRACRMLQQLYKQTDRADAAQTAGEYQTALETMQDRLEAKASSTISRLEDASPPPGEIFWLLDNDKDRMWQIEATLMLGLTRWTAPRKADRNASLERLTALTHYAADPMLNQAAKTALALTPEDIRKVR